MSYTWATIKSKLEMDLALEDEQWIDEDELMGYANEAVREAEAEIKTLYEDYFLSYTTVTFVSGQSEYSLPADIYASKIRRFLFEKNSERYTIERMRDWKKFEDKSIEDYQNSSARYAYFLVNTATNTPKILLSPPARQADAGAYGKLYYLRDATQFTASDSVLDIPEFVNFIYQHVKWRVYEKEGHPNVVKAEGDLEKERLRMVGTLAQMVPDADNEIEGDFTHYEEMN